jgi:biotin operon repressor
MQLSSNGAYQDKTNLNFFPVSFNSEDNLLSIVRKDWMPSVVSGGRNLEDFVLSQFIFGDVDNDSEDESESVSIAKFAEIFADKEYWIITSRNHQKLKGKKRTVKGVSRVWDSPPQDRYHVLFPLENDCWDSDWLSRELDSLCNTHKFFDNSAKGATRFYFGADNTEVFYHPGEKWKYTPAPPPAVQDNTIVDTGPVKNQALEDTLNQRILDLLIQAYNSGEFASYADWTNCGIAMKACGFDVEDWKQITNKDVSDRTTTAKWNGFKGSKSGKGTLVHYARKVDPNFLTKGSLKNTVRPAPVVAPSSGSGNGPVPPANPSTGTGPSGSGGNEPVDRTQPMPMNMWKDVSSKWHKTPASPSGEWVTVAGGTISNFKIMLEYYGISSRENMMKHIQEVSVPGYEGEGKVQNAGYGEVVALCKLNKIDCISQIDSYLSSLAFQNKYHPVKEWLESGGEKWDGKDRFDFVSNTIILNEMSRSIFNLYLRKWLISCVAAIYSPEYRGRGVLTFQGAQYQGKSTFFKMLMPDIGKKWFKEGLNLDPRNKDAVEIAISHWICEMGELEGVFKRSDLSALKAFLTMETDTIRMSYEKRAETYPRRTVYCATVNDQVFLVDNTGSSRFWVVPVSKIDLILLKGLDVKQFWLQVREWYANGEQWWMSDEEDKKLQEINENFSEEDEMVSYLTTNYNVKDASAISQYLRFLSLAEIGEEIGFKTMNKATLNKLARALRETGFKYYRTAHKKGYMMPSLLTPGQKDAVALSHNDNSNELEDGQAPF